MSKSSQDFFVNLQNAPFIIATLCAMIYRGIEGGEVLVNVGRPGRSLIQNRKLWPMLEDISEQVVLHGNKYDKETWKQVLTAHWRNQTLILGIDNMPVLIGRSTSLLNKAEFSELIEIMYAYGAGKDVKWSEKATKSYQEHLDSIKK